MNPAKSNNDKRSWLATLVGSILILLVVFAVLGGIAYTKVLQIQASMEVPPPPEMPIAVTVAEAKAATFRRSSVVIGTVLAPQSITLRNELTGVVTDVLIKPGSTVRRGDVLLHLDTRTEVASLKSAEAMRVLADSELKRAERLTRVNANSEQELDAARAELARAAAEVERLQVLIDKKTLRAPFDARVGVFDLHVGQYLVEGTEITSLEGLDDYFHIDFAMPAHVADSVAVSDTVQLVGGLGLEPIEATIIALDSRADPISRSLTGRARLSSPPPELQPNDSVRVTVSYGSAIESVEVPATAVRRGPSGTLVYVAIEQEGSLRAEPRDVVVANSSGTVVRILSGVMAGERVVADGSFKVVPGALLGVTDVSQVAEPLAAANQTIAPESDTSL